MKHLELPPTLRTLNFDEVPKTKELIDAIEKSKQAKIVEGFTFTHNETHDLPFNFYAEINIDNSRLWDFFKTLALHLPVHISLIYNRVDEKANFGEYLDKFTVLNSIEKYKTEITQDCWLEFGVIHQTDEFLEEIFVDSTKFIKYWGCDEEWFRTTMNSFNIYETQGLNFIDEFPKVTEALRLHNSHALETEDLIEELGDLGRGNQ